MKRISIKRVRILYLLLVILTVISVLPHWFYGSLMISRNRIALETQENVLQTTTSQSLAREISLYVENLQQRSKDFFERMIPLAARVEGSKYEADAQLRQALEQSVADWPTVLYATVVNQEARGPGVQSGGYSAATDTFILKRLTSAFTAVQQGAIYESEPINILRDGRNEPVVIWGRPIVAEGKFLGMVAAVVTLAPIQERLKETHDTTGLESYIVDNGGKLVAASTNKPEDDRPGRNMIGVPIVQRYLSAGGRTSETSTCSVVEGNELTEMLGTFSPIQKLNWGVIVQRKTRDAYLTVAEMRGESIRWGVVVILLSLGVAVVAAKSITRPLDDLTRTARAIARRDFSQRADVRSKIAEVAEVAEVLNSASQEIQRHIADLKAASEENARKSEENRQLFMESIQMIAAAVDAKDPYTKGHSKRVSDYSVELARELGLPDDEVEKIHISATLHDVGKIGVEDRVLKKPGVLTNEEFELMKRHTVMGWEIVRQVQQLAEMLPGIRWHHEALNGKGYPDGKAGDELPLMVRIISVADTFDAVTTDRPYQDGRDFPSALEILRKHAGTKYDPLVVDALHSVFNKGKLSKYEVRRKTMEAVPQPAS